MFVPFKLGTCHECLYELWEINRAYLFVCHRYWLRGSTLLQISPWMEWRWEVVVKIHTKEPCNFEVSIESQVSFGCSKLGFLKRLLLVFCCRRHYYVFNIWMSCFFLHWACHRNFFTVVTWQKQGLWTRLLTMMMRLMNQFLFQVSSKVWIVRNFWFRRSFNALGNQHSSVNL